MKSSGLADSPFFKPSTPLSEPPKPESSPVVYSQKAAQANNTSDSVQISKSTDEQLDERNSERKIERTEFRTENRSEKTTSLFPRKRRSTRYSFEFYEDQILKLKAMKHEAEMNGEKVTLSDLAREALDQFLDHKDS
jgi:hypothetical protein